MRKKTPIFYNALILTGVNLLLRFVGTSFQVYLSGKIGAAGIGLLQLVMSVGSLALTAGTAGVRTAAMYLTAEELGKKRPENVSCVLSGCFLYSIICSGFISVTLYLSAPSLATHWIGNYETVTAIRLYAVILPLCCLCGVMTGYFTAANRIGTLAVVEVAEQLFSMTITLTLLYFWSGRGPSRACQAVILGSGAGFALTLICLCVLRMRENKLSYRKIPVYKRLLSISVPLALADDLKSGISTTENLMVPKRLALYPGTADSLADFGLVCGMVFPVIMFPAAFLFGLAELLIPELARCAAAGSQRRIQYLVQRSLHVAVLYGALCGGLLFLISDELCIHLFGSTAATDSLRLYCLLLPMLYCDAITDAMTKGLGQQVACVRYNIITSLLDVVMLFVLLPRFGMRGYFLSFLITHLLNFILSLRRLLKISGSIFSLAMPLLTIITAIAAVWAASHIDPVGLRAAAFVLIIGCLLFLCRVLDKEDIFWLKGLLFRK